MIKVSNLSKSYGDIEAVKKISFNVEKGTFFAFLGPNGAGKSTTINMLCTLLKKDSGDVIINGHQLEKADDEIRSSIGVVFQHYMLDGKLTIYQNLYVRGHFYRMNKNQIKERIKELQKLLSIDYMHQPYQTLSGGQKRRADIARALIHKPKILILDEPTTGLDPKTRQDVWSVINDLRKENMTIFLTTHYMEEAAKAAHVVVMNHGLIVASGSPAQLKNEYAKDTLRVSGNHEQIIKYLKKNNLQFSIHEDVIFIQTSSLASITIINDLKEYMTGFEMIQATLDDVFIDIIGKEILK